MGYETMLIVGKCYNQNDKECLYLSTIASLDLCGNFFEGTWIDETDKESPVFFYNLNQSRKITKDCYGEKLYAIDPVKVLELMKAANKLINYRRYNAAIPMLENLIKDFSRENLKCILFGH